MGGGVNSLNSPKLKIVLAFAAIFSFFSITLRAQTDTKTLKLFAPPSGSATDSILLWRSDSTVREINSSQISIEPWLAATTTNKATNNTQNIYQNGKVGIGNFNTTTPATALDIENGTTNGAIKIVDGTQNANYVLTSDANGVGTWKPTGLTMVVSNKISYIKNVPLVASATWYPMGMSVTLPPGQWKVDVCYKAVVSNPNKIPMNNATFFMYASLSEDTTVSTIVITPDIPAIYQFVSESFTSNSILESQGIYDGQQYPQLTSSGFWIVNNTSGTAKTYSFIARVAVASASFPTVYLQYNAGVYLEDKMVATPITP